MHPAHIKTIAFVVLASSILLAACGGRSVLDVPVDLVDAGALDGTTKPPVCSASTCATGCCDTTGTCRPGNGTSACGSMGKACIDCVAAGFEACDTATHACKADAGVQCGPGTCAGCCMGNACFMGSDTATCGSGGQACVSCAAVGDVCVAQKCQAATPPPPTCGPGSCDACCQGQTCMVGTTAMACGTGGAQCAACPPGSTCTPTGAGGGECQKPACGAANCPAGCCDGMGNCQPGNVGARCGHGGATCQVCTAVESCSNQQCVNVPPPTEAGGCNAQNCPTGCCDPAGNCVPGTNAALCGSAGNACQSCMAQGEQCVNQRCLFFPDASACNAQTCPAGCCDGTGTCVTGVFDTQCGNVGGACQNCSNFGSTCVNQRCFQVCNFQTCPNGCCDQSGNCRPGTAATLCGTFGNFCQDCTQSNDYCTDQQCQFFAPDAGICNSQTCPSGCCDQLGTCRPGSGATLCGGFGQFCQDCTQSNNYCTDQQCQFFAPDAATCDSQTCPFGCCDPLGNCQPGSLSSACGSNGNECQNCSSQFMGSQCLNQNCQFGVLADSGVCDSLTCPTGCCDNSGVCQQGVTGLSCGNLGANCQNCLSNGDYCSAKQECVPPPGDGGTTCNAQTCPFGCCDAAGTCQVGFNINTQCGGGGNLCLDCTKYGATCFGQTCYSPDGSSPCSQSCSGCCDSAGNCQGGFLDTQCGQNGGACQNCATLNPASTCDVVVQPRVCASQQTVCPGVYPACPVPLQEPKPTRQMACSTADLQNAAAACSGGAATTSCNNFFNSVNTACGTCLTPFDVDFVVQSGVRLCVAPFVDATCNHNSACIADCTAESCYNCPDSPSTTACETQVQTGTCATYVQADSCVTQALAGTGAVCNPATYQGNFGGWLQAVGAKYCGP
ncbi:MAG: hypothetical protein WBY94_28425 [Polyangiaceae bacterium]